MEACFALVIVFVVIFAILGIAYGFLAATMAIQRIWQRHYHILTKRELTKVSLRRSSPVQVWILIISQLLTVEILHHSEVQECLSFQNFAGVHSGGSSWMLYPTKIGSRT